MQQIPNPSGLHGVAINDRQDFPFLSSSEIALIENDSRTQFKGESVLDPFFSGMSPIGLLSEAGRQTEGRQCL